MFVLYYIGIFYIPVINIIRKVLSYTVCSQDRYAEEAHLSFQNKIKSACSFCKTEMVDLQQISFGDHYQCYEYSEMVPITATTRD